MLNVKLLVHHVTGRLLVKCFNSIVMSPTCFEHPSVHPQEDLYMHSFNICLVHLYYLYSESKRALNYKPRGRRDALQCYVIRTLPVALMYPGADKSLARPGMRKRMSRTRAISTTSRRELSSRFFFSCNARRRRKFTPF